ncbi:hypothetical protein SMKI_05G1160 [Saccharomyces mikatae IFO 1815]|uniref:Uncharacterized protein n=1 Tax=Saccharomyces mikatae IFO 1815 TaxID=226126 RepID=A0AA35NHR7_SACMI|nr:uncharacterized protein SMKI_05G1160 [Saccharomyces mikatae IFO 1815]CAI4038505.1 hypothetical protein SMKI_05G1160 [Saccharomyces mikatae IFO 1815]
MGSLDSSLNEELEIVPDSQISGFDSPLIPTGAGSSFRDDDDDDDEKVQPNFISDTENDTLESDEEFSSLEDSDLILPNVKVKSSDNFDPILKRKALNNNERETILKIPRKIIDYVPLKNFNLGDSFDSMITTRVTKLRDLEKEILDSPSGSTGIVTTSNTAAKSELQKSIKCGGIIPEKYLDVVTKETISDKYKDWYFISENCHFEELMDLEMKDMDYSFLFGSNTCKGNVPEFLRLKCPNITNLLVLFGVNEEKCFSLRINYEKKENAKHDNLCTIYPTDKMLKFLMYYYSADGDVREVFLKAFICLILDRNVFNAMGLDHNMCLKVLELFDHTEFINSYFEIVCKDDFFLHYRLLQIFPNIQTALLGRLFNKERCRISTIEQNIINEFNEMFDYKNYKNLLYFILMMYGSKHTPFGPKSQVTEYFKDCILDISNETTNDVEISILKGILNLFSKIR